MICYFRKKILLHIFFRLVKDKNDVDNLSAKYVVYGAALGRTTLMISALNKKNERINSAVVEIQVGFNFSNKKELKKWPVAVRR